MVQQREKNPFEHRNPCVLGPKLPSQWGWYLHVKTNTVYGFLSTSMILISLTVERGNTANTWTTYLTGCSALCRDEAPQLRPAGLITLSIKRTLAEWRKSRPALVCSTTEHDRTNTQARRLDSGTSRYKSDELLRTSSAVTFLIYSQKRYL
jgi:hypothetical protein